MYCFDTDVLSATMKPVPPLSVVRRISAVPEEKQFTTSITLAELLYGLIRRGGESVADQVAVAVRPAMRVLPFDRAAAEIFAPLRVELERDGRRLDEPDLRIASIALARDLILVTGNVRHFSRVPGLHVENWLA